MKRNHHLTRRQALAGTGATLVGTIAGCASLPDEESEDGPAGESAYERLQRTAVYVDSDVDLSIPDDVPTVSAPNNADLIVLPGDTEVGAERAVDWLADERVLALLGDESEPTWLAWVRSDVYTDTFRGEGAGDAEPDPNLLVAAAIDVTVTTYRFTWGEGPRDRDVLQRLDETLDDIQARTPQ